MNIFKWLKNKAGKVPVTLVQAAGITAVVGAAGFAAMNFLSSPADNNNTFIPPSATGEVVYVSQGGGGGTYESNGEVGSSFRAAPSRAIQLTNQQEERAQQARALEASSQQSYGGAEVPADGPNPRAYQLSNGDLGLGMGSGQDKQLNSSLDTFSTIQNQLKGVTDAVAAAGQGAPAAGGAAGSGPKGAPKPGETRGSAAQLASASHNWGEGGLTRAGGGGSGSSNAFVVQDSGKNPGSSAAVGGLETVGDALASAQAAMNSMQEGNRLRAQARFGKSENLGEDHDANVQRSRRFKGAKDELEWIRKQSAMIAANNTNAANEGGVPFLASTRISGGLTVDGENVTTGQGASSGDLNGNFNRTMGAIGARLDGFQTDDLEQREKSRADLLKWMWWAFPTALVAFPLIARLKFLSDILRKSVWPATVALGWALLAAAVVIYAVAMYPVLRLLSASIEYAETWGGDGFSTFAGVLSGVLAVGLSVSLLIPIVGKALAGVTNWIMMGTGLGIGLGGAGIYNMLSNQAGYEEEVNAAEQETQEQIEDEQKAKEDEWKSQNGGNQ